MKALNQTRSTRGNILVLVFICFSLVCLFVIAAFSFGGLFFVHNRLQSSAEEIALAGAAKLNVHDRLGQMNNMVARCRQLVFSSLDDYDETNKRFKDLEPFALTLLEESKQSARYLETERKQLVVICQSEVQTAMQEKFDEIKTSYRVTLPWLIISEPQMKVVQFGKVRDVESNVKEMKHLEKLYKEDQGKHAAFVDYPAMKIYKAEKDQKLDGADVSFKLSSLTPAVNGEIAQARILLPDKFAKHNPEYAPSTTRVELSCSVQGGIGFNAKSRLQAIGIASTTGGGPQR